MTDREEQLFRILKIALDTSLRGEGISLHDALKRTRYSKLRPSFEATDLLELINQFPEFVNDWIAYSEDKRTSGGWYITKDIRDECQIGQETVPGSEMLFRSSRIAVAEYAIRELDFWVRVGERTRA